MKKNTTLLIGFLLTTFFVACKKETLNTTLEASKISSIKIGEPVLFKLLMSAGDSVTWSVNPSANTTMQIWSDSVYILFGASGNYSVSATYGNVIATCNVSVTDSVYIESVYIDSATYITKLVPDEEIRIFLYHRPDLDSNKIPNLIFQAQTSNSYSCSNNFLLSELTSDSKGNIIKYYGVSVPDVCVSGTAKAQTDDYINDFSEGSSLLTIVVNGKPYSGTITKTGTKFTIHWPYTSGVTISPTSL